MYTVKKNNRRIPNKVFDSYEKARQWVRKKVRSVGAVWYDQSDYDHRTPSLGIHGYSIQKVEG